MSMPSSPPQGSPFQATTTTMPPEGSSHGSNARPGGVTFAGVLGIVYASIALLSALAMMFMGAAFGTFFASLAAAGGASASESGAAAGVFGGLFVVMGVFMLVLGAFGLFVGIKTLQGQSWARWVSVVLFALGGLMNLFSIAAVYPVIFLALDAAAVYFLVNADATRYFEGKAPGA